MGFIDNMKIRRVAEHGSEIDVNILADEMKEKGDAKSYAYLWLTFARWADLAPGAWFTAGYIYEHGVGVSRDYGEAFRWYMKSADCGWDSNEDAMYKVGCFYENGLGVAPSYDAARQWYRKAASHGSSEAQAALERL